ncbi:MAG: phage tail protein [Blastocatellia bacterium]
MIPEVYGARPSEVAGGATVYEPGGVKMAGNIIWSSGIRKTVTTTPGRSGKGAKAPDTQSYSYDLDLAILLGKGPLRVLKIWANTDLIYDVTAPATGVFDPDLDPDTPYNPDFPPDPLVPDVTPGARYGKQPATDGDGTTSATLLHGNYAALRIYAGNEAQLPDPLIQGVVDAQYGAGSTPAYRGNCYVVLEKFVIDRWGTVPNLVFLVENTTYTSLRQMAEQRCEMAGLHYTDYDFSNLDAYPLRGLYVNQREAPRRSLENAGRLFGLDFITHDGLVTSVIRSTTSVATITANELGMTEGGSDAADSPGAASVPPRLETRLLDEVQLPRRIDLKFFDPEKDHQVSTAGAFKQITRSERHETIETPLTLIASEARQMAERELVAGWIEQAAHTFSLGPKYAWLRPSDVVTIVRDGFTHLVRLAEIQGAVPGALKMQSIAADAAIYDVVAAAASQPSPPVAVKLVASTVVALMDVPWLRDQDTTPGFYAAATTRGGYEWPGANLYVDRGAGWESVAEFTAPAVMGRAVTPLQNGSSPGTTFDTTSTVTLDLYWGELDSATAAQVLDGANFAVLGHEVIQFQTASRVSGYANRWTLSGLRRGQKKTGGYTATHASGERFVLLNSAVRFVPMQLAELGLTRTWKGVTAGQSPESAAPLTWAWQGHQVVPDTPTGFSVTFIGGDSGQADYLDYQWTAQPGITYELASDQTFSSILWRGQASGWRETSPGRNRAGWTRYLRATLSGVPSAGYATVSYGVAVPPAPRIGPRRQTSTSLVLQIGQQGNLSLPVTDPATLGQVRNTVVEIADDAAFTQNLQVERRPGVRTDIELAGTPGQTVYVRTYFETIFGDTTPVSDTYQHTFALGGDGGDGSGARFGNIWFEPDNTYDIGRNPSSNAYDRRPKNIYAGSGVYAGGYEAVSLLKQGAYFSATRSTGAQTPGVLEPFLWPRLSSYDITGNPIFENRTVLRPGAGGFRIQNSTGDADNLLLDEAGNLTVRRVNSICYAAVFGGADAGVRIQAAIDSLPATGGTVEADFATPQTLSGITISKPVRLRFGATTFTQTAPITINAQNVIIEGLTPFGTTLIAPSGGSAITVSGTYTSEQGNLCLKHLLLSGSGGGTRGLSLAGTAQLTEGRLQVENCTFRSFSGAGAYLGQSNYHSTFRTCQFFYNTIGIDAAAWADLTADDCYFYGALGTSYGIRTRAQHTWILNCSFIPGGASAGADVLITADVPDAGYVWISRNKFGPESESAARVKIKVTAGTSNLVIPNLTFVENNFLGVSGQTAISFSAFTAHCVIEQNYFSGFQTLIEDNPPAPTATSLFRYGENVFRHNRLVQTEGGQNPMRIFASGGQGWTVVEQPLAAERLLPTLPRPRETTGLVNRVVNSETPAAWVANGVTLTGGKTDPLGTTRAAEISRNSTASSISAQLGLTLTGLRDIFNNPATGRTGVAFVSFWMKQGTGTPLNYATVSIYNVTDNQTITTRNVELGPAWKQYTFTCPGLDPAKTYRMAIYPGGIGTAASGGRLELAFPQMSDFPDTDYLPSSGGYATSTAGSRFSQDVLLSARALFTAAAGNTADLALARNGAGLLEVTDGGTTLAGLRAGTLSAGNGVGSAACRLLAGSGGNAALKWIDGSTEKWWLYRNFGDASLALYDAANSRIHLEFVAGNSEAAAITRLWSALHFHTDNLSDIGGASTARPRDVNIGRNLAVGGLTNLTGGVACGATLSVAGAAQFNHTVTIAGSAWNGNTLRMGSYYFWIDGLGRLRMKNGAPTSDGDGQLVGAQS